MSWTLPIPLKKFSVIDWTPLTTYTAEHGDGLEEAVVELSTLREALRNTNEKSEAILNSYYNRSTASQFKDYWSDTPVLKISTSVQYKRYYAQICSIDFRVPVNEQEVRLSFQWYDVYKERKFSMNLEKAGILWNIFALHSHLGSLEKRQTDESIKMAAKHFQLANGVIGLLKKELEAHPTAASNLDLSLDNLHCMSQLMYGHSQECYYDLALKGGKMPGDAISKLAFQVSSFFDKSTVLMETSLKDSYIPRKWLNYSQLKRDIYKAISYYQLSLERLEKFAYGEQVSRLQSAHRILDHCKKEKMDKYIPELTEFLTTTANKIAIALQSANKDNNTIYHEVVPSEQKLPALSGHTMAKVIEPEASKLTLTDDPFAKIVPFAVQKADSIYCEKRGDLMRSIIKQVEEHDGLAKTILAEMGLPASLDSMESASSINTLQSKITTLLNEGGVSMLQEKTNLLDQIAEMDQILLKEAIKVLDDEEAEDRNARKLYSADEWTRTPSHTLTTNLRQEGHKYLANFEQARKSDEYIKSKFALVAPQIKKLASLTRDSLLRELPADQQDASPATKMVIELRNLVSQINGLADQRAALVAQLRKMAASDNIINILLSTTDKDKYPQVYDSELEKYSPVILEIEKTFSTQNQLLQLITAQNTEFLASRRVTPAMEQRQAILQTYETAFQSYLDLKAHLKEGAEFYSKFQDILTKFKGKCSDFAFARKTELNDLIDDIKSKRNAKQLQQSQQAASNVAISNPVNTVFMAPTSPPAYVPTNSIYQQQQQQYQQPIYAPSGYYQQPQQSQGQSVVLPPGYSPVQLPPGYTLHYQQQQPPGY